MSEDTCIDVCLKFSADVGPWVSEQLWHSEQKQVSHHDGSLCLTFTVADLREAKREMLKYGAQVEVLSPDGLRKEVREEIRKMAKIYFIRGKKVMLDRDLAELYGVETKVLKQAVRRNIKRFAADFMFELKTEEEKALRSQIVTLKRGQHSKYLSFAFTEQGVAMLSSILNSDRAIQVNIQIMRAFSKLREMLSTHDDLKEKIEARERKFDQQFQIVFEAITQLLETEARPMKKIGFTVKEKQKAYTKSKSSTTMDD